MVLGELEADGYCQGQLSAHLRINEAIPEGVLAMCRSRQWFGATLQSTKAGYSADTHAAWQTIDSKALKSLLAPVVPVASLLVCLYQFLPLFVFHFS
jgi:hypothetical protein